MRYRISTILLSCLAIAVTLAPIAHADDGASQLVAGGAIQPMGSHPSIRMVNEIVDVKLGDKGQFQWPAFVRCQFEFHNDGPATDVIMAFPEQCGAGGDSSPIDRLKGFKSWVDDKPAKIKYMPSAKNDKSEDARSYRAWYVKTVHFDAGQTRKVVDMYAADLGYDAEVMTSTSYTFNYVMRTGASWKGRIDKTVINIDTSAAGGFYKISPYPKGCAVKGSKYQWVFTNFEPKNDVGLDFEIRDPLVNGKPLEPGFDLYYYYTDHGVLMAPPDLLSAAGAQLDDNDNIKFGGHKLKLVAGSSKATIDGKSVKLSHAAAKSDEGMLRAAPLEDVVRLLGGRLEFTANHTPNVILRAVR